MCLRLRVCVSRWAGCCVGSVFVPELEDELDGDQEEEKVLAPAFLEEGEDDRYDEEELGDDPAPEIVPDHFRGGVFFHEAAPVDGIGPHGHQHPADETHAANIKQQRKKIIRIGAQQRCREGDERDPHQVADVQPDKIVIDMMDMVHHVVVDRPEDRDEQEREDIGDKLRDHPRERLSEAAVDVSFVEIGDLQVEDQQGDGDGEDAVTEGDEARGADGVSLEF